MTFTKNFLTFIYVLNFTSFLFFTFLRVTYSPYAPTESFTVGDGKTLKVGILGDTQLIYSDKDPYYNYTVHLEKAFKVMRNNDVAVIIFTGDISNCGHEYAFKIFKDQFDKAFPDNKPILNIAMGNHDYYYFKHKQSIPVIHQKTLEKVLNEKPFSHKIINGYHFINWGSMNPNSFTSNTNLLWANEQIEQAVKDNSTKPVFVNTHLAPYGTMYGSDLWGTPSIGYVLKHYEQVISFSGHSHYALTDERSIWQGEYTAIQTQAIAYIELEYGKENGSIPTDEFGDKIYSKRNYMGLIMNVQEDKIELQRISFENDGEIYKEKSPWIVDLPIEKKTFRYVTEKRILNRTKPYFENGDIKYIQAIKDEKIYKQLQFTQAKHEDFVHSYRIIFKKDEKEKEFLYFSDFFLMPKNRTETLTVKISNAIEKGEYDVSIYAIESFGLESTVPLSKKISIG